MEYQVTFHYSVNVIAEDEADAFDNAIEQMKEIKPTLEDMATTIEEVQD